MKKIVIFLFGAILLSSCSVYTASISETMPQIQLEMNDVDVSDEVTATASVKVYFGIFVTGARKLSAANSTYGARVNGASQRAASYKLMQSNPDYDFILYPKYETKYSGGLFVSSETTTVTAKLGRLK